MRDKLTPEQIEANRTSRRAKRSAFWSRFVDEFKKVGFIGTVIFCMIIIVWGMVLYTKGNTTPGIQVAMTAAFAIIGTAFTVYCNAASRDKDSLNKNGLAKTSSGTIAKIVETVSTVSANLTTKTKTENPGDDDIAG